MPTHAHAREQRSRTNQKGSDERWEQIFRQKHGAAELDYYSTPVFPYGVISQLALFDAPNHGRRVAPAGGCQ